jgi:hypothetical protein
LHGSSIHRSNGFGESLYRGDRRMRDAAYNLTIGAPLQQNGE